MFLMVQNWELLEQLRNSMVAEEQLIQAQNESSMLRMQLMQTSEQAHQLNAELDKKDKQIVIVLSEKYQLINAGNTNENRINRLDVQIATLKTSLSQINLDVGQKQTTLDEGRQKIIVLTQERDTQSRKFASLEENFGSLKVKYDKLIKPARTEKAKYVVSVNYERINGKERIRFKDASDKNYTSLTEKKLHSKLAKLKKKYPKKLYIKIVIPKESGLSYNEA